MKKSLIALAALAASGTTFAQSSVTVYGITDVWVGRTETAAGASETKMKSGGLSTSRLGFKGTEDLGGGLKANFVLEQGVDLVSGANDKNNALAFTRETSVGISGAFGAVKLGRFTTAYDSIQGKTNPGFDSDFSAAKYIWKSNGHTSRPDQGIRYDSPKFGGFSAAISYNLDPASDNDNSVLSAHVQYADGPIYVGLGYQDDGDAKDKKFTRINGSYDFGVAKLLLAYGRVNTSTVDTAEYTIGADVPVAPNTVVSVGYVSSKTDAAARLKGWNVVVAHNLSKRTTVYGGYVKTDATALDNALAVGIKHTF